MNHPAVPSRYEVRQLPRGKTGPALALRRARFGPTDEDRFDKAAEHWIVMDGQGAVAALRVFIHRDAGSVLAGYSAQHYGLDRFAALPGVKIEVGRLATDPTTSNPDVLRSVMAALTRAVDAVDASFLFGCSSFAGADLELHRAALARLGRDHLAPDRWRPHCIHPNALPLPRAATATGTVPSLLAGYLQLGGGVSDHAVIDRTLDTLHVFTGVEIAAIPPRRAARLRALAGAHAAG